MAKSLWHVYNAGRSHMVTENVPAHFDARPGVLPAFHLELNFGYRFDYGDLLDLCQALRILTMEMNQGQMPVYGGTGFKWYGTIRLNGPHSLAIGRFFFD